MTTARYILQFSCLLLLGLSAVFACAVDDTLREYLNAHFWLPFAKSAQDFEKGRAGRIFAPFAGMEKAHDETALANLRAAYQEIAQPDSPQFDSAKLQRVLAVTRSVQSLTPREREEVNLIDAKIDMRAGSPDLTEPLENAKKKLAEFLRTARTPEYLSEARGWLARVYFLLGQQAAAGKIYLDELNRNGSNLSSETLINSLRLTYGYDGGPELLKHLDDYFDTPEHAAFAIHLVTNPHWTRGYRQYEEEPQNIVSAPPPYERIKSLLERHSDLLRSDKGANTLALLSIRTALRAGDPPAALRLAAAVPSTAAIRGEPDFTWMLASAHFLSRHYTAAERPLLRLFRSSRSSADQKAAAAYALCGVYQKIGNPVEQVLFALWLHSELRLMYTHVTYPGIIEDQSIYWAMSGWDLGLLLDAEVPIEAMRSFLDKYPKVPDVRLVKYSLAVRLAREDQYEEAGHIYEALNARRRASRMRQLAALYREANRTDLPIEELQEAKYKMAEFIGANPDRIYFNDELWSGFQRYALYASKDSRLTREERQKLVAGERKLKDDQEERWRAYLLLREVALQSGKTDLGRRAAQLGVQCLRGINERFERSDEIRAGIIELSWRRRNLLRRPSPGG